MPYTTLITPADLYPHLADPAWAIVDCRFVLADPDSSRRDYRQAHIPGAVYAHLRDDLAAPPVPGQTGRHPLPDPATVAARARAPPPPRPRPRRRARGPGGKRRRGAGRPLRRGGGRPPRRPPLVATAMARPRGGRRPRRRLDRLAGRGLPHRHRRR